MTGAGRPVSTSESDRTPEAQRSLSGYRLYFLGANDHIRHVVVLECPNDEAAIELAESHRDARTMELWLLDRMVKRFERHAP